MTKADFIENIFDFEHKKEWSFKGTKPAIIDFHAEWCGPCKQLGPVLDRLQEEYKDKLVLYKVDVDKEEELASVFGISSVPSILFIPMMSAPIMFQGAAPYERIKQLTIENLKI